MTNSLVSVIVPTRNNAATLESCLKSIKEQTYSPIELIVVDNIPEESFGMGFWSQCKRLERSFCTGVPWVEAARFFSEAVCEAAGGYHEALVALEDWDLSKRAGRIGKRAGDLL